MFNNLLNANIGLGDLLVYALFAVSAYKGFGRRGALIAFPVIVLFGAIIPSLAPLIIHTLIRSAGGIVIPAQTFFGPVAFLTYLWLKRRAPERSMAEWYKVQNPLITPAKRATRAARPRPAEQPALADVQSAAQGSD